MLVGFRSSPAVQFSLHPGRFHRRRSCRRPEPSRPGAAHRGQPPLVPDGTGWSPRSCSGRGRRSMRDTPSAAGVCPCSPLYSPQSEHILLDGNACDAATIRVPYHYLLLPTSRPAALPQRNPGGSGSIPTKEQRRILRLWFDAARWCYNETVARLRRTGEAANWKAIKTGIIHAVPERHKEAPYQVKSIAIRDACQAMSEVKRRNKALGRGCPATSTTSSDSAAARTLSKVASYPPLQYQNSEHTTPSSATCT